MHQIQHINSDISLGILDLEAFAAYTNINVKRECELNGTEFLLKEMLNGEDFRLMYSDTRKPFLLNDARNLSISHSHGKLVIILNQTQSTGIDIELIRDKVIAIRHKFMSESELQFAQNNVELLTFIWAAKECMYKTYGLKNVDFAREMKVEAFTKEDEFIFGALNTEQKKAVYKMKKEKIGNYVLVYMLHEV